MRGQIVSNQGTDGGYGLLVRQITKQQKKKIECPLKEVNKYSWLHFLTSLYLIVQLMEVILD